MKHAAKGFLGGLAIVALVLVPACRSSRGKDTRTQTTTTVAQDTAPTVTIPAHETAQQVQTDTDFVKTDTATVKTETLPENSEELNRYVQERGLIRDAFYGYDEASLNADAQAALTQSASWLRANAKYNLLIEGHCDERGTEQYNLALGDKRAQQAKDFLVAAGVDASRIRTVSYGEERPFDPGHDESSWQQNRRAHLVLVGR